SENGKDETKTDMEEARFLLYGGGTHGILRNFIGKSLLPETPASRVEEIRIKIMTIAEEVVGGSERSAARLISLIERENPEGYDAFLSLLPGRERPTWWASRAAQERARALSSTPLPSVWRGRRVSASSP